MHHLPQVDELLHSSALGDLLIDPLAEVDSPPAARCSSPHPGDGCLPTGQSLGTPWAGRVRRGRSGAWAPERVGEVADELGHRAGAVGQPGTPGSRPDSGRVVGRRPGRTRPLAVRSTAMSSVLTRGPVRSHPGPPSFGRTCEAWATSIHALPERMTERVIWLAGILHACTVLSPKLVLRKVRLETRRRPI